MHGFCFEFDDLFQFIKETISTGLIYDNKMSFETHIEYFKANIPWISSKSSLAQNGVLIELIYWKYVGHL